jgi:hypothetical protein
MRRVPDLYVNSPVEGRVIYVDAFGPLNLIRRKGKPGGRSGTRSGISLPPRAPRVCGTCSPHSTWAPGRSPTYRIRPRKRWPQFLDFCKTLRRRWPGQRLYLVVDNHGLHGRPGGRVWCAANTIELVSLPTNASWLSWIACEFSEVISATFM